MYCWHFFWVDVASAEQQKAAGTKLGHNEEHDAMETEDNDESLQASEVQELKPDPLESSTSAQTGHHFNFI